MINAKILNNKPLCGKCNSNNLSGIREYREIEMDNNKYVLFQVKCYSCHTDNQYIADINLDETIRYEAKGDIKDIKED